MKKVCALLLCVTLNHACFSDDFKIYRKPKKWEFWGNAITGSLGFSLVSFGAYYCTHSVLEEGNKKALALIIPSFSFVMLGAAVPLLKAKRIKQWNDLEDPILVLTKDGFIYQKFDHKDYLFGKKLETISCAWENIQKFWVEELSVKNQHGTELENHFLWCFYIIGQGNIIKINQSDLDLSQEKKDSLSQLFHTCMIQNQKN